MFSRKTGQPKRSHSLKTEQPMSLHAERGYSNGQFLHCSNRGQFLQSCLIVGVSDILIIPSSLASASFISSTPITPMLFDVLIKRLNRRAQSFKAESIYFRWNPPLQRRVVYSSYANVSWPPPHFIEQHFSDIDALYPSPFRFFQNCKNLFSTCVPPEAITFHVLALHHCVETSILKL